MAPLEWRKRCGKENNKFVPSSTSLNAVPAKGAGSVAAVLRVAVTVAITVLPCDTSPGGLLTTMTPRSTYKTVTPRCGRPRACFVAESIRADPAACGPSRRRAFTELVWPAGASSSNPISPIPRGVSCKLAIGSCMCVFFFFAVSERLQVVAQK